MLNKNFLYFKNCCEQIASQSIKRLVFDIAPRGSTGPKAGPEIYVPGNEKIKEVEKNEVPFREDVDVTLRDLAKGNEPLKNNYFKTIADSLRTQGYALDGDGSLIDAFKNMGRKLTRGNNQALVRKFWDEISSKCKTVKITEDHKIRFLDENGKDVAPGQGFIPVKIDAANLATDAPRTEYYNPDTGAVTFKKYEATLKITIADIIQNAKKGTRVKVTAPGGKPRMAEFVIKDGKPMAYYLNKEGKPVVNALNRVKIENGYTVFLEDKKSTPDKTAQIREQADPLFNEERNAGVVKLAGKNLSTVVRIVLDRDEPIPDEYTKDADFMKIVAGKNPKIAELRKLRLDPKKYEQFLNEKNALIRETGELYLIIPSEKGDVLSTSQEYKANRIKEDQSSNINRMRYFLPDNFLKNLRYDLKDEKIVSLLGDEEKWREAWAKGTIEGLRILKGIVMEEPVFAAIKNNPDAIRSLFREAIAKGRNDRFYISDFIDVVLKKSGVRMPSYAPQAEGGYLQELNKEKPFSELYSSEENSAYVNGRFGKVRHLALGFLQKLHVYESAKLTKRGIDGKNSFMTVDFPYEGHIYTVKITENTGVTGDNPIEIFQFGSQSPYPNTNGYARKGSLEKDKLISLDNSKNNEVEQWFRNCVTPPITYEHARAEYGKFFSGTGENNYNRPDINNFYRNIAIAGNRVAFAVGEDLKLDGSKIEQSERGAASAILRNARLENETYNAITFYNANEVVRLAQAKDNAILQQTRQNNFPESVGLQIRDDIIDDTSSAEILKGNNKLILLKAILQTYSLEELINGGHIKKGINIATDTEFYVIHSVPESFKAYVLAAPSGGTNNLTRMFNKPSWNIGEHSESVEYANPQARLQKAINLIFPPENGNHTMTDVWEGVGRTHEKQRTDMRMNGAYANSEFMKLLNTNGVIENGIINEAKVLLTLENLMTRGISKMMNLYPNKAEYDKKVKELEPFLGSSKGDGAKYNIKDIATIVGNPDLMNIVRQGLVMSLNDRESRAQGELTKMRADLQKWKESLPEAEVKQFENAITTQMKKAGASPEEIQKEIPKIKEKAYPVILGFGYDIGRGAMGPGIDFNLPIELGEKGKYGVLILNAGAAIGGAINKNAKWGAFAGTFASYETPKIGGVSFIIGTGVAVGFDQNGFSVGPTSALGVNFNLGGKSFKHDLTLGAAVTPFGVLPAVMFHTSKDHAYRIEEAQDDAIKAFGFDTIDKTGTPEAKANLIKQNPRIMFAVLEGNSNSNLDNATILSRYNTVRQDLLSSVATNYDPTGFNGISFGIGITKQGKFVMGVSLEFILDSERTTVFTANKSPEQMAEEATIQQLISLEQQGEKPSGDLQTRIEKLKETGKLIITGEGKYATVRKEGAQPKVLETGATIDSLKTLENRLNQLYAGINMGVKYDPVEKLFELKYLDWNTKTNYEIAVDPAMEKGGLQFKNGKPYLAADFKPGNRFTVLRTNFDYPLPDGDTNYHTIVTISDNPTTPPMQIYYNTPKMLRASKGGSWYKTDGFKKGTTDKIFDHAPGYGIDNESFSKRNTLKQNSAEFLENYARVEQEKGTLDHAKTIQIADAISKVPRKMTKFKKESIKEADTHNFDTINKFINFEWEAAKYPKESLTDRQRAAIRAELTDRSFSEFAKMTNKVMRTKAFEARIESTGPITTKHFQELIEKNHKKYKEGNPARITATAEAMKEATINRIKNIDVNNPNGKAVNTIDQYNTLAATQGLFGYRGVKDTTDVDQDKIMLGESNNYADSLKKNPDSLEANLAKLFLEALSPEEITDEKGFTNGQAARKLFDTPIGTKVAELLGPPEAQQLFPEGVRDQIVALSAKRNSLPTTLTDADGKAVKEFYNLVQHIREAQKAGQPYYVPANSDFRFSFDRLEVKDGVYKKCTNYSYWMNENISLQYKTQKLGGFEGYAAFGESGNSLTPHTELEYTKLKFAAGVVTPEIKGSKNTILIPPAPSKGPGGEVGGTLGPGKGGNIPVEVPSGQAANTGE